MRAILRLRLRCSRAVALASAAACFGTDGALANEPSERVGVLEIVTIVADPERLPGAVATLDQEDLERFALTDPHQLLSEVPGINFRSEEGYGLRPNIGIRGTPNERSGKITVMEDGVLIAPAPYSAPSAYYFPSMGRIRRVEVVKGPSAITEGPYTVGGALNLISTPVADEAGHRASLRQELGADGLSRTNLVYGFGAENGFGFMAELHSHSADGFDDIQRQADRDTGFDVNDAVVKLRWRQELDSGAERRFDLKLSATDQDSEQTYVGLAEDDFLLAPHSRYGLTALDRFDAKHRSVSARYSMLLARIDWSVALFSNRFERDWFKVHDLDVAAFDTAAYARSSLNSVFAAANDGDARALAALRGTPGDGDATARLKHNARKYASDGAQLRLGWAHGPHELRVGLRVVEDEEDRLQYYEFSDQVDGELSALRNATEPSGGDNRLTASRGGALFVEESVAFGDWSARFGLRRESYRTIERRYVGGFARSALADGFPSAKADQSVTLLGAGVHWRFSDALDLFAGLHQGFTPTSGDAEPERADNLELGLRYGEGDGLRIDATLFHSDYRNIVGECRNANQGAFSDCEPGAAFDGGEATIRGLELRAERRLEPVAGLGVPLSLTYSHVDSRFDSTFNHDDYWGDVQAGDPIPYLPKRQLSLRAGVAWRNWRADLGRNSHSDSCSIAACTEFSRIDSWHRYDLSVAWESAAFGLQAYLAVHNLTDETNLVGRNPSGARAQQPRTALLGLRYQI